MNRDFWAMATGRMPADVRIDNVRIMDVFNGEIREGSVSFGQGRILGFSPPPLEEPETMRIGTLAVPLLTKIIFRVSSPSTIAVTVTDVLV